MTTPTTTNETADDTGPITHAEAHEIASRYNHSHWRQGGEVARYTIPADPRRDDDIRLRAYIKQNAARDEAMKLWREEALAAFPIVFGQSQWEPDITRWNQARTARINAGLA